jgi:hypothetical protein
VLASPGLLLAVTTPARAQEGRLYLRGDYTAYRLNRHPVDLSLGPFLKLEERFRGRGLVYDKLSAGMKVQILSWLTTQLYYAHQDLLDASHVQKYMVVGDIIAARRFGDFRLLDRNGNEWHATDGYYRYRNYLEVLGRAPISWLTLWAAEELRIDSDQARINQNDVRTGIQAVPGGAVAMRLFYDLESLRRNLPTWGNTWYIGLALSFSAERGGLTTVPAAPASRDLGRD